MSDRHLPPAGGREPVHSLSFEGIANEEELKVRYIVPLLQSLGLQRADLQLERSFSIHAGRQRLDEDLGGRLRNKHPRFDVLVTRGGRNLFIIELKQPQIPIKDNDHLQAISYARLLHPIAPYAIVTNGTESRLYSTVTRDLIDPADAKIDVSFEVVLPSADDFDALDCFLRLSLENLLRFSRAQVNSALTALRGSPADPTRKYIPELHVPRQAVGLAIDVLLQSSKSKTVLAVVADAGLGKTCEMCHRAVTLSEGRQAVLFFRGSELGANLLLAIANEFAWTFREELAPPALFRRLSHTLGAQHLLLFIDGIDEWQQDDASQQLGSLARHLATTLVRVVVSCKSSAWPRFLERQGTPTDFEACVLRHNHKPGALLEPFSNPEFHDALRKYREFYGFHGVWDKSLLDEARRSPFFMRIAFQVARDLQLTELRETTREIFERYFQGCLGKAARRELSERLLVAVARALYEGNMDRIDLESLRSVLGLGILDELPEEPFVVGALERIPAANATVAVRFVFDGLRNYVIAVKTCLWPQMRAEALHTLFDDAATGVQEEAFIAYYRLAPEAHQRALDHRCFPAAANFLAAYKEIIRDHFAAFAASFPPGDLACTGLVLEANLRTGAGYGYGVRRLQSGDPEVLILPAASSVWFSDSPARWGAGGLSYRLTLDDWLHGVNPHHELLTVNIVRLLRKTVEGGALNEQAAPDLAKELLAAAVLSKPALLNEPNRGPGTEHLPLTAGRIRYWLLLQQHWSRLENKLVQGEIPFQNHDTGITYSPPPLTEEERQQLRRQSDSLVAQGAQIAGPRMIPFDNMADRLKTAIDAVGSEDVVIEGPLFPPFQRWPPWPRQVLDELPDDERHFFLLFLENYQRLVAANFPTLEHYFALFRRLPILIQLAVRPPFRPEMDPSVFADFFVPYGFQLEENVIEIVPFADRVSIATVRADAPILIGGRAFKLFSGHHSGPHHLRGNHRRHPDLGFGAKYTVIRDFTYSWIERELGEVVAALGNTYGLPGLRV
jgi:hypothetical protein